MQKRTLRNQNFVHPPNPPLMKLLLTLVLVLSFYNAKSQILEVPQLSALEASLKLYHNQNWTAERAAFVYEQKGKILNYLPSVGFSFGLPTVSYSSQSLFAYKENKKARSAALASLDRSAELKYNEELNSLRIEFEKLQFQKQKVRALAASLVTEEKIFSIWQEAHRKKELKPLEFLQKKRQFEDSKTNLELAESAFNLAVLELQKMARFGQRSEKLHLVETDVCTDTRILAEKTKNREQTDQQ